MTSLQRRVATFFVPLMLAALATAGVAHGQGFSSVSAGAPVPPPAASTSTAAATGTAANPASPAVSLPATSAPPPTTSVGIAAIAPSATLAAVSPEGAAGSSFSSGGGSFSSVSGGPPSAPAAPARTDFGAGSAASFEMAEKVVVLKKDRRLQLLRRGRVIAEYPIKLGLNPYGPKLREGDFRTPEGKYELVARNSRSEFFLSIKISYPNREDAAVASESGYAPGGLIMIHGQPNVPKKSPQYYASRDWTDGCIALSNADMVDVWLRTSKGIPIEIRP